MLDILVVNYNTGHLLRPMFDACGAAHGGGRPRYLVVDNASKDASIDELLRLKRHDLLIRNRQNVGFGRANNQLLDHLEAPYVLLLNTDAFVQPNSLVDSLAFMAAHPRCGVLGVRLTGQGGEIQPSCRYFPTPLNVFVARAGLGRWLRWVQPIDGPQWAPDTAQECDWVPGCFYLIRREVIDQIGLFDPRFFLYYEEIDHCRRVKAAGWKVMYSPHTSVVHLGGESARSDGVLTATGRQLSALQVESELLYFRKHHGRRGLLLHLALVPLGDVLLAVKDVLRGRGWSRALGQFANARLTFALWRATRFATQSTR